MLQIKYTYVETLSNITIVFIFQLYHGSRFYWWWKPEYLVKTTDLAQVTDKLT
jgi:hypothetical protein